MKLGDYDKSDPEVYASFRTAQIMMVFRQIKGLIERDRPASRYM